MATIPGTAGDDSLTGGIDPDLMLMNREDRPIPIVDGGKPLLDLFG